MPPRQFTVSANTWYSGSAQTYTSCSGTGPRLVSASAGCTHASICSTFATRLRCVSVAPFDTPVVPPVYCRNATSCGPTSTGASLPRAPASSASLKRTWPGSEYAGIIFLTLRSAKLTIAPFGKPSRSPIEATTTCLTDVFAITCCSVAAKFSRITIASAPESFSWCSSSRGVYSGLTLTTT